MLRPLLRRLESTRRWIERELGEPAAADGGAAGRAFADPLESAESLAEPLRLCHASLRGDRRGGDRRWPAGRHPAARRRLRPDARATRHPAGVDASHRGDRRGHAGTAGSAPTPSGAKSSASTSCVADADRRRAVRARRLRAGRPRRATCSTRAGCSPPSRPSRSAPTSSPWRAGHPTCWPSPCCSRRAACTTPLRIVPLFEVARDLQAAGGVIDRLLSLPWYRDRIALQGGRQEVMIGYSDSSKDAGRLAAAGSCTRRRRRSSRPRAPHGVPVTLFHGRGGSVGRGGGPTYLAIQSQPPGSVDGTIRVTEQGEMVQAKFGLPGIALRTLEVYTTATLDATLAAPKPVSADWRRTMDRIAHASRRAFRKVVYEDPRFLAVFASATPEGELDRLHIGSRPARRSAGGALDDPARDSVAVCLDPDATAAAVVARRRGTGRRRAPRVGPGDVPGDVPIVVVLPIDPGSDGDGARQGGPGHRRVLRPRAGARRPAAARRRTARPAGPRPSTRSARSRAMTICSRTMPCCADRLTCAIRTSTRSISSRSNCCAACARQMSLPTPKRPAPRLDGDDQRRGGGDAEHGVGGTDAGRH